MLEQLLAFGAMGWQNVIELVGTNFNYLEEWKPEPLGQEPHSVMEGCKVECRLVARHSILDLILELPMLTRLKGD